MTRTQVCALPARDRQFEAEAIRNLASGLGINVEPLIAFASRRADMGAATYGRDFPDLERDFEMEGLEELGDCCQYIVWRLDGIRRDLFEGQEWKIEHLQPALKYVALAFEELRKARDLGGSGGRE